MSMNREENELITSTGPGTPWAKRCGATGFRRCCHRSCRSPTARRCASSCSARSWWPSATPRGGSACSTSSARTAGSRYFRAQRGMRPALRLSRLEVRRRRHLRGHAERAGGARLRRQDPDHSLSHGGTGRRDLGLPGAEEQAPPLPKFAWTQVPDERVGTSRRSSQECNWLQALEGGIDTSHAPILHSVC